MRFLNRLKLSYKLQIPTVIIILSLPYLAFLFVNTNNSIKTSEEKNIIFNQLGIVMELNDNGGNGDITDFDFEKF